jgi:glycosyltransferase involved in cell wall biosynthesis
MSWSARKPIVYEGVEYGQKDVEFWRVADLPRRLGPVFEIALAGADAPRERIAAHGWRLADPRVITATPWTYRDYLARSRGEFSVAVNLEVKSQSGWFSDRTAAYLACGKPVIVQDTGFSETLPCGEGLFAFRTADDVALAVEAIARDYRRNCEVARDIAAAYFDSDRVLGAILRRAGVSPPGQGASQVAPLRVRAPEAEP